MENKKIKSALISVFYKDGLSPIVQKLKQLGVTIYSTGGTGEFLKKEEVDFIAVENITGYPSILGGRVKTLHPAVFGGILSRRDIETDVQETVAYKIPEIDLVIVDLYPFEETVKLDKSEQDIIEKIDIGGIALIRAAAKNFKDVVIVPSVEFYGELLEILENQNGETSIEQRRSFAAKAFEISSHYDIQIFNYFNKKENLLVYKASFNKVKTLRYGENPHQKGYYFGDFNEIFDQISGKEISYNNLLDIDAAVHLIEEFEQTTFAILKHNNACGLASDSNLKNAYIKALAGDPLSAFGGVLITNKNVDVATAEECDKLFFEIIIAPSFDADALEILKKKKNRIILIYKGLSFPNTTSRTLLNGVLVQERDSKTEDVSDLNFVTQRKGSATEVQDLLFANKIVKHTKSNAIVLAKDLQLVGIGTGSTSRVDALKHAIRKAQENNLSLKGSVIASDAFFPFPDSVQIAQEVGIEAVIQPGGSIKDQEIIDFCNSKNMAMAMTGFRHFKH